MVFYARLRFSFKLDLLLSGTSLIDVNNTTSIDSTPIDAKVQDSLLVLGHNFVSNSLLISFPYEGLLL